MCVHGGERISDIAVGVMVAVAVAVAVMLVIPGLSMVTDPINRGFRARLHSAAALLCAKGREMKISG